MADSVGIDMEGNEIRSGALLMLMRTRHTPVGRFTGETELIQVDEGAEPSLALTVGLEGGRTTKWFNHDVRVLDL